MVDESKFRPVIKELIRYYYENLENGAGGYLHIVLDDGNLKDENISFCQELCTQNNDHFGYLIATVLRTFIRKERYKMYKEHWK